MWAARRDSADLLRVTLVKELRPTQMDCETFLCDSLVAWCIGVNRVCLV